MSYNASTYVVYDALTTREKLTKTIKGRGCNHGANEKAKFCGECGKPVFIQREQFLLEEYDNPAYDVRTHGVSFHSPSHDSCEGVVGFQLGFTSDENIGEVNDPTPEMKAKIEDFFKQFDI